MLQLDLNTCSISSSWPRGRFRRSWPRLGGSSSPSLHLEPNLRCPAGSKDPVNLEDWWLNLPEDLTDGQVEWRPRGDVDKGLKCSSQGSNVIRTQPNIYPSLSYLMNFQEWLKREPAPLNLHPPHLYISVRMYF